MLFIVACVHICNMGDRPFTPENISAAFSKISVFVWLTVGATVLGMILKLALPTDSDKPHAKRDKKATLSRLMQTLNEESCNQESLTLIKKERKLRVALRVITTVLCLLTALPAVVYSLNLNNFNTDYNASVIAACACILPCTFISIGFCIAFAYLENASLERQLKHVKAALAEAKVGLPARTVQKPIAKFKVVAGVRAVLGIIALALIVAGICNGGMADVLAKAINICTECIGLG